MEPGRPGAGGDADHRDRRRAPATRARPVPRDGEPAHGAGPRSARRARTAGSRRWWATARARARRAAGRAAAAGHVPGARRGPGSCSKVALHAIRWSRATLLHPAGAAASAAPAAAASAAPPLRRRPCRSPSHPSASSPATSASTCTPSPAPEPAGVITRDDVRAAAAASNVTFAGQNRTDSRGRRAGSAPRADPRRPQGHRGRDGGQRVHRAARHGVPRRRRHRDDGAARPAAGRSRVRRRRAEPAGVRRQGRLPGRCAAPRCSTPSGTSRPARSSTTTGCGSGSRRPRRAACSSRRSATPTPSRCASWPRPCTSWPRRPGPAAPRRPTSPAARSRSPTSACSASTPARRSSTPARPGSSPWGRSRRRPGWSTGRSRCARCASSRCRSTTGWSTASRGRGSWPTSARCSTDPGLALTW